jgi:hypothetical protein
MATDSDRDDLARIIFTVTEYASWQSWEMTSDGWRNLCRAKADEAMAKGWRKVGAEQVVVRRTDAMLAAKLLRKENQTWCGNYGVECGEMADRIVSALADPAGANGGE